MIYKYLLKKYNKEHNQTMIRCGRSWLKAVRVHIAEYNTAKNENNLGKHYHYKQAVKYLSYAEDYLTLLK